MATNGIDEAWQRLSAPSLKHYGYSWVAAYVSEDTTGKNISRAEIQTLLDAGIGVLFVYEYAVHAAEGGESRGYRDANIAINQVKLHGYPEGRTIAFAIDEDETPRPSSIDAYCRAFTQACHASGYRSMEYGGIATTKWCRDHSITDASWQTYAWSHGQWDSRAIIRQTQNGIIIDGKNIDLDIALVDDFGAWFKEENMALSPEDIQKVADAVWTRSLGQGNPGYAEHQASTALAFAWEHAYHARVDIEALPQGLSTELLNNLQARLGGLTDTDRDLLTQVMTAVTALNNRLATP